MKTVELFCGLKSFSNVASKLGHSIFTSDFDNGFNPDLCKDILQMRKNDLPDNIDVLWASPPCESFSVSSIGKHWNKDNTPKTDNAQKGLEMLDATICLIAQKNPKFWFIENPRGKMRKIIEPYFTFYGLDKVFRHTVTYCQYGDFRMKPTDIWSNVSLQLKPMCKNGDKCHVSAPRGSRTGTQGNMSYAEKSKIPQKLFEDIFLRLPK